MPRRTIALREEWRELLPDLVRELQSPQEVGQPMVFEQIVGSNRVSVEVVWDRLAALDDGQRITLIREAFTTVEPERLEQIAQFGGFTVPEAIDLGMLKFSIVPMHCNGDLMSSEEYRQAMISAGASTLVPGQNFTLRYRDFNDALQAMQWLERHYPNSHWAIAQNL